MEYLPAIINAVRVIVDVVAVYLILYYLIKLLKRNVRTMQLFKGVILILIIKLLTTVFNLTTLNGLVDTVLTWGVLGLIVIFQPEIRTVLERMGQTRNDFRKALSSGEKAKIVDELVNAISSMAKEKEGALITFEQNNSMQDFINTGVQMNCEIKSELLRTIFYEGTPLHDGATIIRDDEIVASSCFYPPTEKEVPQQYGARHRAAIGISEITDSLTIVVSEETGRISFVKDGNIRTINPSELRAQLVTELYASEEEGDFNE